MSAAMTYATIALGALAAGTAMAAPAHSMFSGDGAVDRLDILDLSADARPSHTIAARQALVQVNPNHIYGELAKMGGLGQFATELGLTQEFYDEFITLVNTPDTPEHNMHGQCVSPVLKKQLDEEKVPGTSMPRIFGGMAMCLYITDNRLANPYRPSQITIEESRVTDRWGKCAIFNAAVEDAFFTCYSQYLSGGALEKKYGPQTVYLVHDAIQTRITSVTGLMMGAAGLVGGIGEMMQP